MAELNITSFVFKRFALKRQIKQDAQFNIFYITHTKIVP